MRACQIAFLAILAAAPGLAGFTREYVFTGDAAAVSNLCGGAEVMRLAGGDAVRAVEGVGKGAKAVALDSEAFESASLDLPTNAFGVVVCLKPIAAGTKTGNGGSVNGAIVCSGSGYNDGWRICVFDREGQYPVLEIGRPEGAWSLKSEAPLNFGFWNVLAATWDGSNACVYINGELTAKGTYTGNLVLPKSTLKVGYAGFGVGSLKMAVASAAFAAGPEKAGDRVGDALLKESSGLEEAQALRTLSDEDSVKVAVSLFARKDLGELARGTVINQLVRLARKGAEMPSELLAKLPECLEMDSDDQRVFGLALAEAFAREGKVDAACGIFEKLLSFGGALEIEQAPVRERYAVMLLTNGRREAARAQFVLMRDNPFLPTAIRQLASLDVARTFEADGTWAEAAGAFLGVANDPGLKPHLREEALRMVAACERRRDGRPAESVEDTCHRLGALPKPAVEFFVAPDGDDTASGTLKQPFATLERARRAVDTRRKNGALPAGGAVVWLRGGKYSVRDTFRLTELDSGTFNAPVVYSAWRDEVPVLDGGFRVKSLRKVADAAVLARLPEEVRGHVCVADVKAQGYGAAESQKGFGYGMGGASQPVRELYEDGKPLRLARWPNEGMLALGPVCSDDASAFICGTNRIQRWSEARDLLAFGYWKYLWADETLPVAKIDAVSGRVSIKNPPNGLKEGNPYCFMNLLEEIDQPGEWYFDAAAGKLYVWPKRFRMFGERVLTRFDKPFIHAVGTREVQFRGIVIQYGQQGGIVLERCVNATVAGCVVRRMGGTALQAVDCAALKIYGNRFHTLGHAGMHVVCGNRATLTAGHVIIENNEVYDFSRYARTYNPALHLEGCGVLISHNHFHDAPSSAMRLDGNDFTVEYNVIDHVVQESDDQGGIDMWGDPSYRGVVIRYNVWKDIGGGKAPCGQAAIRFDDAICGAVVYGNRFERTSNGNFGAVQIHGGRDNIIDSNLIKDCRYGVSFSPWGMTRWTNFLAQASIRQRIYTNVNIRVRPYSTCYPELNDLPKQCDVNSVWRNVFIGVERTTRNKPQTVDEWKNRSFKTGSSGPAFDMPLPPAEWSGNYDDPACAAEPKDGTNWRNWGW